MLRMALMLFSGLQIGTRIKEAIQQALWKAAVVVVAAVFMLAATVFGLIAAYDALISIYQFMPLEAAGIMAACLLLVGLVALAIVPLIGREPTREKSTPMVAASGQGLVDQGLDKAVQQIGPVPLIAIAFFAGLLAGRR